MEAQDYVDDYETIESSLEELIDEVKSKEFRQEIYEILTNFRDTYSREYEENQEKLDREFEEEKKQQEEEYWADQF